MTLFDDHYEVLVADTAAARDLHFRLRYQVYCEEYGWEDPSRFPDGLERDQFDRNAVHFLARERVTGRWIAGLRLVFGPLAQLPMMQHGDVDADHLPHAGRTGIVAELSRLFVLREYRARSVDHDARSHDHGNIVRVNPQRAQPLVMLGLIRAARQYSLAQGIDDWYFLTTPALARILQHIGLGLQRCGPARYHRGRRVPYHGALATFFDAVAERAPLAHAIFERRVKLGRWSEYAAGAPAGAASFRNPGCPSHARVIGAGDGNRTHVISLGS